MLTEFGIHYRLEICANLLIKAKTLLLGMFFSLQRGKRQFVVTKVVSILLVQFRLSFPRRYVTRHWHFSVQFLFQPQATKSKTSARVIATDYRSPVSLISN